MADTLRVYNSVEDYISMIQRSPYAWSGVCTGHDSRWSAEGKDIPAMVRRGGSEAEQAPIKALLAKLDATIQGREKVQAIPSLVGSRVCVPDVLQGHPMAMRRRTPIEDDRAPIRVAVEIGVSQGVNRATTVRRGAAIAALVMRLSEIRPTELWIVQPWVLSAPSIRGSDTHVTMIRLHTTPISLSELAVTLVNSSFARGGVFSDLMDAYKIVQRRGSYNSVGWGWGMYGSAARMVKLRKFLGFEPQDILLPGGVLNEHEAMFTDPVAWVNSYLDPQREIN